LAAIDEWMEKKQPRLMSVDQEFIERSREKRDRLFQEQLEKERRLREEAEGRAIAEIEKAVEADARAEAETARAKESEIRIKVQKQKARWSLATIILLAGVAILALSLRQELEQRERSAIEASFIGPQQLFQNGQQLESLIASAKVLKQLKKSSNSAPLALQNILSNIQEVNRLEGHIGEVMDVSFSPDGELIASSGRDNSVRIWTKGGKFLRELNHKSEFGVWDIQFSRNGRFLASADGYGIVRIWNTKTWSFQELKFENLKEGDYATAVSFNSDNSLLIAAITNDDNTSSVVVWDTLSHEQVKVLKDSRKPTRIFALSFNPVKNVVVIGDGDGTINLKNIASDKLAYSWTGHSGLIQQVSFSPDGKLFATAGSDKLVKIWRTDSGHLEKTLKGHRDKVNGVIFSPSGEVIASSSKDETIKTWDVETGKPLKTFIGHTDAVNNISFSKDGETFMSASDDGTIRQWIVSANSPPLNSDFNALANYACKILKNYLNNKKLSSEDRKVCDNF